MDYESYFEEKSQQVQTDPLMSFGVPIDSRYGKASEIAEMLLFTKKAAEKNLCSYIRSVFYDGKSNVCYLQIDSDIEEGDLIAQKILEAALLTISQFDFFGEIYHRLGKEFRYCPFCGEKLACKIENI